MQIFIPHKNLDNCAMYLDDLRLNIQLKELGQILSTAIFNKTQKIYLEIYKPYNRNGRFVKFTESSRYAFEMLINYGNHLHNEYKFRFKKNHKSFFVIQECKKFIDLFPEKGYNALPRCKRCQDFLDQNLSIYDAYKQVLIEKWNNDIKPPKWTNRKRPKWSIHE